MSVRIELKITKEKSNYGTVEILCPFCPRYFSKYEPTFRMHLSRTHSNEIGIEQVKKEASKIWRLYREAKT